MGASEHTEWMPPGVRWSARPSIGEQPTWRGAERSASQTESARPRAEHASAENGAVQTTPSTPEPKFFEAGAPSFMDLLDIINPLQHIPVVSSIYRHLTGDTIGHIPRVAGGALFFGPIGAGVALANVIIDEASGRDVGAHLIALLTNEDPAPTTVAQSKETPPEATSLAALETAAGFPPIPPAAAEPGRPPAPATAGPVAVEKSPPEMREALQTGEPVRQQKRSEAAADPGAHKLAGRKAKEPMIPASMARRQWASDVDAFAAVTPRKKRETQAPETAETEPQRESPGAAAPDGGWFSKTMLDALEKYQKSSKLTETPEAPAVSVVN